MKEAETQSYAEEERTYTRAGDELQVSDWFAGHEPFRQRRWCETGQRRWGTAATGTGLLGADGVEV